MPTSGAEKSRRFGGSGTRATRMLLCSDRACGRAALCCQDTCPSAARPPPKTLPDHLPAISRRTQTAETLQFFYLKEKKKKINHTKNKTTNKQEFRVALLALCALVASTCCCGREDPASCTTAQLLPRPVARLGITSPS